MIEKKNMEIRSLGGEVKDAQEQMRVSSAQQNHMVGELGEYKNRLNQNVQETETYKQRINKLMH